MSLPHSRGRFKPLAVCLAILSILVCAGYGWYRYKFPHGYSHCCSSQLGMALRNYADLNNGHFPAGENCPEASLSLLRRYPYDLNARVLAGKTKSAARAAEILARGELLCPDTCDWHYVEGLTLSDDPGIALVWDKVGLAHFGQRLPNGGHTVLRLSGGDEVIPDSQWKAFLDEQERLMAVRTEAAKK